MTDTPVPQPTAPQPPTLVDETAKKTKPMAWVALGLGVLGFIFACIPGMSLIAWVLLIPAFIVAIVALAQKGGKKGAAVFGLILSVIGGIVAVVVSLVTALTVVSGAIDASSATWTVDGQTAVNQDGVKFTLNAVSCGLDTYGTAPLDETPNGQFCEVTFSVENGSDEGLPLLTSNITGLIGDKEFEAEGALGGFGDDLFATNLNPGLSVDGISVIDVPADSSLDSVKFAAGLILDDGAVIPVP